MATIDVASNSALLEVVEKLEKQNEILSGSSLVIRGDNCYIRYSAYADGTDFTETRSEGQVYIGFATGQAAPTDKAAYQWTLFEHIESTANVVQIPGDDENVVMSQKATTDAINAVSDNIPVVVQSTGDSETAVMSQKAVTDEFAPVLRCGNVNRTKLEYGTFDYVNGKEVDHAQIYRTDGYIPVKENTLYQIYSENNNRQDTQFVYQYDSDKNFLGYQVMTDTLYETGVTVCEGCNYIRLRTQTGDGDPYNLCDINTKICVEEGSNKSHIFTGAELTPKIPLVFSDNSVMLMSGLSKVNKAETALEFGSLDYLNGKPVDNANILRTKDFIEVNGGVLYQIYSERGVRQDTQFVFEYASDKTFIKFQTMSESLYESGITTDANCRYIKIRTQTAGDDYALCDVNTRIMVEVGETKTFMFDGVYAENLVVKKTINTVDPTDPVEPIDPFDSIIDDIETHANTLLTKDYDFGFLCVTDIHSTDDIVQRIMAYFANNHIGDFVANLGDTTHDKATKEEKIILLKKLYEASRKGGGLEVYNLRGNHENNPVSSGDNAFDKNYHVSDENFYNAAVRGYSHIVNSYPNNYYYRDFDHVKIRVIILDGGDIYDGDGELRTNAYNIMYQQEQIDWLANTALNFMDKDDKDEWSVITLSHCEPICLQPIINAFLNGTSYNGTFTYNYAFTPFDVSLSCDFTQQGAMQYIAHVNGHNHEDAIRELVGVSPVRSRVDIRNATVNATESPSLTDLAMDFIMINKNQRKVDFYRIGAGENRIITY